ncbi:MAG: response regulator [Phenylobacterium sp.]|uniref:ATP-binding protein n=1 Tax=Phenylobacterium sp. TaxID=1871053 RepID=UPI00121A9DEB|nr:ATP-binding protein [Phenylobacterium sp.]TAJ73715.1 MAG: response regulator [Phenylobacterium sp.]
MRHEDWAEIARLRVRDFPLRAFFSVGIAAAIYFDAESIWPILWLIATLLAQLGSSWISSPMRAAGSAPSPRRRRLFILSIVVSTTIFASVAPLAWFIEGWQGRVLAVTVLAGGVMNVRLHANTSAIMLWSATAPFMLMLMGLPLASLILEPGKRAAAFVCLASLMYVAHLVAATRRSLADARSVADSLELARLTAEALERTAEEASAASRSKSEFLANMSHEIRTPLNGVMGVSGALGRTPLSESQREMVHLIEASAKTLETLLSDILDLARIESGKMELCEEPLDLAASVKASVALFDAAAQAKGLDLQVEIRPEALGTYVGDAVRLRQILANLLSNAVKFTQAGEVRLIVEASPGETGVELRFAVRDTGIGFDEETKARLFCRFEQADGSITRRFGGSGLGLSISRSLAEAMGGRLEANAAPGQGAVFTLCLELPRARSALEDYEAESAVSVETLAGRRVLLAEDHPTNRRVVELILGAVGVEILCVENGEEAVAAFKPGAFDLVLMDMQMPVMDGLSAIKEIRKLEIAAGGVPTPILVLTANAMPEHVQASIGAGADGHFAKPVVADQLLKRVAEAILTSGVSDHEAQAAA